LSGGSDAFEELDGTSPPPQAPSIATKVSDDVTRANRFNKKVIRDPRNVIIRWLTDALIGELT
jgi:hypothetical protein